MTDAVNLAPATFPTPWAARAFALVSAISEVGWFSLRDFQQALIESIASRESSGGCVNDEATYYDCWIESLTKLLERKGLSLTLIEAIEGAIRSRLVSKAHAHAHDHAHDHDHGHLEHEHPRPLYVEAAR